MKDEGLILEDLKTIMCALNDIRVLLASTFTREYIFECLRQDSNSLTKNMGVELVKTFLQAVMVIQVQC
jgi:hypothetical protein